MVDSLSAVINISYEKETVESAFLVIFFCTMISNPSSKKILPAVLLLMLSAIFTMGQDKTITVNIELLKTHQTINNFGASDAWSCQFIGKWPDEKRNKIADLLFSSDTLANGSPKGIALSIWRFNIGAGSTEQEAQSGIKDEWRRAESFLNTDGSYNWQKQTGQIWFLKAAKQRGVVQFLGFNNSPPVQFTVTARLTPVVAKQILLRTNTMRSPITWPMLQKELSG